MRDSERGRSRIEGYGPSSDGSLRWDTGIEASDSGTSEGRSTSINVPVGTILALVQFGAVMAVSGGSQSDLNSEIVRLAPVRGYLDFQTIAATQSSSPTRQVSMMAFAAG